MKCIKWVGAYNFFFRSLSELDQFLVEKDVEGPGPDASIWQPLLVQTLGLHQSMSCRGSCSVPSHPEQQSPNADSGNTVRRTGYTF